jgi:hypothetical protein
VSAATPAIDASIANATAVPLPASGADAEVGAELLTSSPLPSPSRLILGVARRDLALMTAFLVMTLWAIWATTALVELQQRRIVSVSLSTIIKDFVAAQSRAAVSPEIAAARTRAYLSATDAAMQSLARDGTTVLVSEAVVGNSVPDMTGAVSAAVNDWLAKAPAVAVPTPAASAATAPAMPAAPGTTPATNPFADTGNGN